MITPRGFDPGSPLDKPFPLKSHPGLAMAVHPPEVPAPGRGSPVSFAANNGYSRSFAGLPWQTGNMSLKKLHVSSDAPAHWTPFRSMYTQSFVAHDRDMARVLNHEKLDLTGDHRPRSARWNMSESSKSNSRPSTPNAFLGHMPAKNEFTNTFRLPLDRRPGNPFML